MGPKGSTKIEKTMRTISIKIVVDTNRREWRMGKDVRVGGGLED